METHEGPHLIATLVALSVQRFTFLSCLKVDEVRASKGTPVIGNLRTDGHEAAGPDRDFAILYHQCFGLRVDGISVDN